MVAPTVLEYRGPTEISFKLSYYFAQFRCPQQQRAGLFISLLIVIASIPYSESRIKEKGPVCFNLLHSTFFYPIFIYGSKKFWLQQNFPFVRPSLSRVSGCLKSKAYTNRPPPSPKNHHFQNEAIKHTTFLVLMSFICMRMKNHFHIKG